uniref:helix-turn-helix transcriptional regulator n=1 Tax=uncultured Sphingomonas sp. TaxID=158754 RepID=UPI0035CC1B41
MATRSSVQESLSNHVTLWVDKDIRARILIDNDMNILWMNHAALGVINLSDMFYIIKNRLSVREERQLIALRSFIKSSGNHPSSMWIRNASHHYTLCVALALSDADGEPVTGLVLRPTTWFTNLDGGILQAEFSLTTAERRVIEALFGGLTADEVAANLAVSVGTVRAHIRHIYDKLDVGSREALFHKILPFSVDF